MKIFISAISLILFAPSVLLAAAPPPTGNPAPAPTGNPAPAPTGNPAPSTGGGGQGLQNPLSAGSIPELLLSILEVLIVIAIPIIVFFIIFAGFKYVTARGNVQEIETAHKALAYAVIGGVIIIGAQAIATIVENLVNNF